MVFVPYWLDRVIQHTGRPWMRRVPGLRPAPSFTLATVAQADDLATARRRRTHRRRLRRERLSLRLDDDALILRVDEAAAHQPVDARAASTTSLNERS